MHFVKFETARIQDCIDFIQAKGLHRCWLRDGSSREVRVKATGGGAIRFAGGRRLGDGTWRRLGAAAVDALAASGS
jgi:pantothenate kinase